MRGSRDYYPNRHLCDVLSEMRKCTETHNYSYLPALIEEAQSMANRMEAGLADRKDLIRMQDEWHKLRKKIRKHRKEKK